MPHFPKPFYRKNRSRWYVEYGGKQVNLGPDRDEAFRQYHQLMAEPEQPIAQDLGQRHPGHPPSVAELCDRYLSWVQTNRSPSTYEGYCYRLQMFVDRYPSMTLAELKPYHVQQWVDARGFTSSSSRRNYMRAVKTCLRWCVKQGYIEKSPLEHMELPSEARKDVYISPEEFQRLLSYVQSDELRELFVLTYEVGCRPQESLRVEARHVDVENRRWVFPINESKGKRAPRIVYLTPPAFNITERLMSQHPTGPLFCNTQGTPMTPESVNCAVDRLRLRMTRAEIKARDEKLSAEESVRLTQQVLARRKPSTPLSKRALDAAVRQQWLRDRGRELVPRYSLYALRHSWATNALKRGVDPLTVAILMGHQDPSMLAKVYQHLSHDPRHLLEQAKRAVC